MKKIIQVEQNVCDFCNKEQCYHVCFNCGKDICYDCRVTYPHSLYTSGSGDGYYCPNCDMQLSADRSDELHNTYLKVKRLRVESESYYIDLQERSKKLESFIEAQRKPCS